MIAKGGLFTVHEISRTKHDGITKDVAYLKFDFAMKTNFLNGHRKRASVASLLLSM